MFKTEMGSNTYQKLFDLVELDKQLQDNWMKAHKDDPALVQENFSDFVEVVMTMREKLEDQMVYHLASLANQERKGHDVRKIDDMMENIFSQRGILDRVKEIVGDKVVV